jgi:hypothetical protein
MCGATRYPLCANSGHALSGSGPIARATGPLMQGRLLLKADIGLAPYPFLYALES